MFCPKKNSAQEVLHEQEHCHGETANHQWPIAAAFLIIQIASTEEFSSLTQNLMQIHCSTHCHCECSGHTVHMLTQQRLPPPLTNTVKSSLFTHVHSSPWLPGYMDVEQTTVVTLTLAVLLLDRPCILVSFSLKLQALCHFSRFSTSEGCIII